MPIQRNLLISFILCTGMVAFAPVLTMADGPQKIIIDMDAAMGYPFHDIDDGLMALIALNSPELEIVGITSAWGNHNQKKTYAKAMEILETTGNANVPCMRGATGLKDLGKQTPASKFIAKTVMQSPGEITILAVGTMTNVATAIMSDPKVAPSIKKIVCMGGTLAPPGKWPIWAMLDLNFGANVKASRVLFNSGAEMHIAHSGLCMQTIMTKQRYERMIETAPYQREMLKDQTGLWFRTRSATFGPLNIKGIVPWDVTALAMLMHPEWFENNWIRGEVDNKGWGYKTVRVYEEGLPKEKGHFNAPSKINEDAFWEWFFERI